MSNMLLPLMTEQERSAQIDAAIAREQAVYDSLPLGCSCPNAQAYATKPQVQDITRQEHEHEQRLASACVCASPNDGLVLILSGE